MVSAPFATRPPGPRHVMGRVLTTGDAEAATAEPLPPCSLGETGNQVTTMQGSRGSEGGRGGTKSPCDFGPDPRRWGRCQSSSAGLRTPAQKPVLFCPLTPGCPRISVLTKAAGAPLAASLVSGSAARWNPLGNVETRLPGPHLGPMKSEAPGTGLRQQEFLKPSRWFQCAAKTGAPASAQPTELAPAPAVVFTCLLLLHLRSHTCCQVPGLPAPPPRPSPGWRLPAPP